MRLVSRHALALVALVALFALGATEALAAQRSVVVTVVDSEGKAQAGAGVVVACDREFIAQTDAQGQVRFTTTAAVVEVTATGADGKSATAKSADDAIRVTMKGRAQ